jgi:hypothetical protein
VRGLAYVSGDRLDILSVEAGVPGCGQFRRFIASAKEIFSTIAVWEDWNPLIRKNLEEIRIQARSPFVFRRIRERRGGSGRKVELEFSEA